MKNLVALFLLIFLFSCGKNTSDTNDLVEKESFVLPYDTVAIDSFSAGATSIDVAREIKMSSLKFQDSLKQVKLKMAEEQLLKKAKEEELQAEKKAKDDKIKANAAENKTVEKTEITDPKSN
jgi:hypothetical protein